MFFQYIKWTYESDRIEFEAKINTLENTVAKQKELMEEGDMKADLIFKQYQEHMQNNDLKVEKLEKANDTLEKVNDTLEKVNDNLDKQNDNLKTVGNELAKECVSKISSVIKKFNSGSPYYIWAAISKIFTQSLKFLSANYS